LWSKTLQGQQFKLLDQRSIGHPRRAVPYMPVVIDDSQILKWIQVRRMLVSFRAWLERLKNSPHFVSSDNQGAGS
jgi:hypothetical protein